ncbi:max dimerization protein 1-like [Homarus americanus]|uniref:max dimerization protein 1-like n=1 Tax=Homarus americanus TaxID=6706 RepID=UPI001C4833BD|nr:max dimerization protein 1-like [Homarus americanus]
MSLAVLLQAAEYIERREREMEHGYASTLPMPDHYRYSKSSKRSRSKSKLQSNRTTHNELEKNRVLTMVVTPRGCGRAGGQSYLVAGSVNSSSKFPIVHEMKFFSVYKVENEVLDCDEVSDVVGS